MKANTVGQQVTGKFNFKLYLDLKYEGFWPESMPTRKDINEAKRGNQDQYKKLLSRYNGVMKEWARLQK